jgi:hypothetical protein
MTRLAPSAACVEPPQQGELLALLNFNPVETYTAIGVVFFLCHFPLVPATYSLVRRRGLTDARGDRQRIRRPTTCPASLNLSPCESQG